MDPPARSWTRHRAWPSASDATRCGVCGRPVEGRPYGETSSPYRHAAVVEPTGFDAERQKKLYERLDVILEQLQPSSSSIGRTELFAFLETLTSWHDHDELWRTIERWRRDHHE
jgi:hypothetical protein